MAKASQHSSRFPGGANTPRSTEEAGKLYSFMCRRNLSEEAAATRLKCSRRVGEKGREKQEEGQRDLEKRWVTGSKKSL